MHKIIDLTSQKWYNRNSFEKRGENLRIRLKQKIMRSNENGFIALLKKMLWDSSESSEIQQQVEIINKEIGPRKTELEGMLEKYNNDYKSSKKIQSIRSTKILEKNKQNKDLNNTESKEELRESRQKYKE